MFLIILRNKDMKQHLFPNFLTNELEYQICKNYWEVKVLYLFQKYKIGLSLPYLNTKYVNGKEQNNGNPIINYYIKNKNKALRIVQNEPKNTNLEISAWTSQFQTEDLDTTELVIVLELTPDAERIAFDFMKKWLVRDYSSSVMEKYIDYVFEDIKLLQNSELREEVYA